MRFIDTVYSKLKRHPKRLVFPEGEDARTLHAARRFYELGLGAPILLGRRPVIEALAREERIACDHLGIINPETSADLPDFARYLEKLDRYRRMGLSDARTVLLNPNYYAAMMVQYGRADGIVGGISSTTGALLRPLLRLIKPAQHPNLVSSCMIVDTGRNDIGHRGVLVFADCGVVPDPGIPQLATIALQAGKLCRQLIGEAPKVALLSFSSKGSAISASTEKVAAAAALARQAVTEQGLEMEIDGELQADAALVPEIGRRKAPHSAVAGRANVLIFPDLNSGNIASKLVGLLGGARTYGQILTGLSRPAADVSRGADIDTIVGVAAIVGLQAIEFRRLQEMEAEARQQS